MHKLNGKISCIKTVIERDSKYLHSQKICPSYVALHVFKSVRMQALDEIAFPGNKSSMIKKISGIHH